MAGFDAGEIWGFIHTHNAEAGYTVEWPHPDESDGMSQQYRLDDQHSEADTYTHESNYTVAPSTVCTSAPTVFSRRQRRAPSTIETTPPRAAPHMTFVEQFPGQFVEPATNDFFFWCEFRDLMDCDATFRGDDEAGWIQHHAQHLGTRFPAETICWFCDYHTPFVAQHKADRQATFEDRMEHIAEHVRSDHLSVREMRPDFHMLEHLFKHRLISDERYYLAREYTELPRELQHPDAGFAQDMSSEPRHRGRAEAVEYNMEKEDREHRRKKKKSTTKTTKSRW